MRDQMARLAVYDLYVVMKIPSGYKVTIVHQDRQASALTTDLNRSIREVIELFHAARPTRGSLRLVG